MLRSFHGFYGGSGQHRSNPIFTNDSKLSFIGNAYFHGKWLVPVELDVVVMRDSSHALVFIRTVCETAIDIIHLLLSEEIEYERNMRET